MPNRLLTLEELNAAFETIHSFCPAGGPELIAFDDARKSIGGHVMALASELKEAKEALAPFAERGRAEFTTGDFRNPEPAPDSQIFGTELFLTIGDLRRAERFLSSVVSGKDS